MNQVIETEQVERLILSIRELKAQIKQSQKKDSTETLVLVRKNSIRVAVVSFIFSLMISIIPSFTVGYGSSSDEMYYIWALLIRVFIFLPSLITIITCWILLKKKRSKNMEQYEKEFKKDYNRLEDAR
jgi:ACR3 family arsenite efflux pump ArsB